MLGAENKGLLKRAMGEIRENGLNLALMSVSVSPYLPFSPLLRTRAPMNRILSLCPLLIPETAGSTSRFCLALVL